MTATDVDAPNRAARGRRRVDRRWIEENARAFADYDAYVARHGVFGQGKWRTGA